MTDWINYRKQPQWDTPFVTFNNTIIHLSLRFCKVEGQYSNFSTTAEGTRGRLIERFSKADSNNSRLQVNGLIQIGCRCEFWVWILVRLYVSALYWTADLSRMCPTLAYCQRGSASDAKRTFRALSGFGKWISNDSVEQEKANKAPTKPLPFLLWNTVEYLLDPDWTVHHLLVCLSVQTIMLQINKA